MRSILAVCTAILVVGLSCSAVAQSENDIGQQMDALNWQNGPATIQTVGEASIFIPENVGFLDEKETQRLNILMQNPPDSSVTNAIVPGDRSWQAFLTFEEVGYVKDDEQLDSEALLQSFKEGTEAANIERKKRGWPALHIVGWKYPPHYDSQVRRLVWALEAESEGERVINYNERLLGRKGVTSAVLVAAPDGLDEAVKEFQAILAGYQFSPGNSYAEFRSGDQMAEYGLGALILGGGAAAVAKSGAAKGLIKFLIIAAVGGFGVVAVALKKLFSKLTTK